VSLGNALDKRRPDPLTLGGLAFAFGSAAALPCHAALPCALSVTGPATPAWLDAVDSLDLRAAENSDCAAIRLTLGKDASHLVFETNDGRSAERDLHDPSELAPTLSALLVTGVPASPEPEPEPEEPDSEPDPPPLTRPVPQRATDVDDDREHSPSSSGADMLTAAFSLQLGARGGAGGLVSPVVYGQVVMDRSRWEIGVWGALEPQYESPGRIGTGDTRAVDPMPMPVPNGQRAIEPLPPEPASAAAVGVMVGRQVAFTHLDVVFGGRVGVAALHHFDGSPDGAELRVGTGVDFVFPRTSTLHFRTGLGAELVPGGLDRSGPGSVPWWAFAARLGFEVGGS
jgi:hypothetical protein